MKILWSSHHDQIDLPIIDHFFIAPISLQRFFDTILFILRKEMRFGRIKLHLVLVVYPGDDHVVDTTFLNNLSAQILHATATSTDNPDSFYTCVHGLFLVTKCIFQSIRSGRQYSPTMIITINVDVITATRERISRYDCPPPSQREHTR